MVEENSDLAGKWVILKEIFHYPTVGFSAIEPNAVENLDNKIKFLYLTIHSYFYVNRKTIYKINCDSNKNSL